MFKILIIKVEIVIFIVCYILCLLEEKLNVQTLTVIWIKNWNHLSIYFSVAEHCYINIDIYNMWTLLSKFRFVVNYGWQTKTSKMHLYRFQVYHLLIVLNPLVFVFLFLRWQNLRWLPKEEVCVQAAVYISARSWHWLWTHGSCQLVKLQQIHRKTNCKTLFFSLLFSVNCYFPIKFHNILWESKPFSVYQRINCQIRHQNALDIIKSSYHGNIDHKWILLAFHFYR